MKRRHALAAAAGAALLATAAPAEELITDIRQGTNTSLALAPDGGTLVVSLLGGLWRMPASGGAAEPLIPAGGGAHNPRFGPDGAALVYQRRSDGQWDLWLLDLASGERRALTETPHDEREPDFSPDGERIVFSSNAQGPFRLWSLELATGASSPLSYGAGDDTYPTVSERGEIAFVNARSGTWSLRVRSPDGETATLLRSNRILSAPSWRPGGGVIVFNEREPLRSSRLMMVLMADVQTVKPLTGPEDVFASRAAWPSPARFLYAADGQIWARGIAAPARSPVHLFAGVGIESRWPEPVEAPLDAPGPHPVSGIGGWTASPSGERFAFTALGDLWLFDGEAHRLTDDPYVELDPRFASDGESLFFASDRGGGMSLWRMDLASATASRLTRGPRKAYRPVPDPSGRRLAYLATDGEGPWAAASLELMHLDAGRRVETLGRGLIDTTHLEWSAQAGAPALVVNAVLTEGTEDREPRREWLAFRPGGSAVPVPPPLEAPNAERAPPPLPNDAALEWTSAGSEARYVVQVGRLFDGIRNDYRRHVDIHVQGQRIAAIVGRGLLPAEGPVIDAREATVIPGLIDVHVHQSSLSGESLGRRWLTHGVTTVRELAHDLPEAIQRGEAWASGRRPGPRLVVTPTRRTVEDAPAPGPGSPVVVKPSPRLSDGFGHTLPAQREQLGLAPLVPAVGPAAIAELGTPTDGFDLRVSPLGMSYQDTLGTIIASGTFISTGLAAFDGAAPAVIPPLQSTLARLVRGGGRIAAGSDAPAVPYGTGLLRELELLAAAQIPNDQVLRIASAKAAMALGLDRQLGTLERGKLADFAVLEGDPLQRIGDVRTLRAVVKGGAWMEREALERGP